jgi:hypothetical protein
MDKYRIEFSNKSKTPFEVGYRTFNSQTTLTLPGKNSVNYGKDLNSCFYHLLESFCNDLPPANPIEGQTWYNTETKALNVYDGTYWTPVGYTNRPTVPDEAVNPAALEIKISNYLKVNGGDMVGTLLLKPTSISDSDNAAVTKQYVDNLQPKQIGDLISVYGNTVIPTGAIITRNISVSQPNQAATKKYADSTVPQIVKTIDQAITVTSGLATGKINTVLFKPANQIQIFGNVDVSASVPFVDILLPVTDIVNECALVNVTGTFDATIDVSAYVTTNTKSEIVLRIIKHITLTKAVSVNFSVSGFTS